jgi:hypothetical protein
VSVAFGLGGALAEYCVSKEWTQYANWEVHDFKSLVDSQSDTLRIRPAKMSLTDLALSLNVLWT